MTEKRFNLIGHYLYDNDKCVSHFEDVKHQNEIIELLNSFANENEQLKQQLTDCEKFRHTVFQQINQEMMKQ